MKIEGIGEERLWFVSLLAAVVVCEFVIVVVVFLEKEKKKILEKLARVKRFERERRRLKSLLC